MYFAIQQLLSLVKLLHSDNSDQNIAWAFVLGFFSAVSPVLSVQGVFFILLALFFRFQLTAFLLSWLLFSLLLLPVLRAFHFLGLNVLEVQSLNSLFVAMQKNSFWSFTQFNNTVVMGGFCVAVLLSPALYFLFKFLLRQYREVFFNFIKNTKVYYFIKSTFLVKIYDLYQKYNHA